MSVFNYSTSGFPFIPFTKILSADVNSNFNDLKTYLNGPNTIQRSALENGTANHVVINSGTGSMSSEAQLALSRGGTGANISLTQPEDVLQVNSSTTAITLAPAPVPPPTKLYIYNTFI